jgi:hypothetical protein
MENIVAVMDYVLQGLCNVCKSTLSISQAVSFKKGIRYAFDDVWNPLRSELEIWFFWWLDNVFKVFMLLEFFSMAKGRW